MADVIDYHYYCQPPSDLPGDDCIAFVSMAEFLCDEPACKELWNLIQTQFKTRSKFFAIWRCVSFIALHRRSDGVADGFLLVSAPINWQIDYVVVHPESRGQKIAQRLITETVRRAAIAHVPYVMLTSAPKLRPMYEACGFRVVNEGKI